MNVVAVGGSILVIGTGIAIALMVRSWDRGSEQLVWLTGSVKKTNVVVRTVLPVTIICLGVAALALSLVNPFSR